MMGVPAKFQLDDVVYVITTDNRPWHIRYIGCIDGIRTTGVGHQYEVCERWFQQEELFADKADAQAECDRRNAQAEEGAPCQT